MSTVYVKCACAHRIHKGQCPHRACGCLLYRPRAATVLNAPRVVRGAVVRELPRGAA